MRKLTALATLALLVFLLACGGGSTGGGGNGGGNGGGGGGGGGGGNGGGGGGGGGATASVAFAFLRETGPLQPMMLMGAKFNSSGVYSEAQIKTPQDMYGYIAANASADGKKIVYESLGISTVNADGTGTKALTTSAYDFDPQFSPDGTLIVYEHEEGAQGIWLMNADGSNQHVILNSAGRGLLWPSFSPDGKKIVLAVNDSVAIMNADGTGLRLLTAPMYADQNYQQWDEFPAFTKSGKIVFNRWTTDWDGLMTPITTLFTINQDGSGFANLVPYSQSADQGTLAAFDPLPLPSGKIVFVSNRDNAHTSNMDLYSINEDGSGLTRLTNNPLFDAFCTYLAWSTGWNQQPGPAGMALRSRDSLHYRGQRQ